MHEYRGCIHIHSRVSDGTGTLEQIVRAGLAVDLDFLVITDHNTLRLGENRGERWYGGKLLVLVGEEVSHSDQHLLALGVPRAIPRDLKPDESSRAVQASGGLSLVAHPHGRYHFFLTKRDYSWHRWDLDTLDGMEVWSYMFDWVKRVKPWNLPYFYLFPDRAIDGPSRETLRIWDELNRKKRAVGIGGLDAHASGVWPVKVFPYKRLFRTIVTYVLAETPLSEDAREAARGVNAAIRDGRIYFAYERYRSASGFRFWLENGGWRAEMGQRCAFASGMTLSVVLPGSAPFRILVDGKVAFSGRGSSLLRWPVEKPGVYRVEADFAGKAWIFSNPITLTEPTSS